MTPFEIATPDLALLLSKRQVSQDEFRSAKFPNFVLDFLQKQVKDLEKDTYWSRETIPFLSGQEEKDGVQEELENNMLTALYLIVILSKIAKQTDTPPTDAMQVARSVSYEGRVWFASLMSQRTWKTIKTIQKFLLILSYPIYRVAPIL